ncbi:MAG: Periplasmic thiol:disulfide interchange protein DsbA, partial [Myxococcales bacterium]|nr:Periplasmic thiol:disulfide interchange protein DsbA [Myxococcales bacterium]
PRDHASGGDHAAITLVEYGDYECSFCGRAYPIIKNIRRLQLADDAPLKMPPPRFRSLSDDERELVIAELAN